MVYKLEIPKAWKIFDTFHALFLMPYKEMEQHGHNFLEPPPDLIEGEEEYEVEKVLASR